MFEEMTGKMVVVRSSQSGVWLGKLAKADGDVVRLEGARRAWSWQGASECVGLAVHGPRGGKITPPVSEAVVFGCCEVLVATDEAVKAWKAVSSWIVK